MPRQSAGTGTERSLLDRLDEVVFETDALGNWTYLNAAWTRTFGWSVQDSLGSNFLQYVHPDERDHTLALFMSVVAGGSDHCHHRTRYATADGSYRTIDLRSRLLRDAQGRVVGNVGTITDVSDREATERAVTEHSQVIELVATGDPAFVDALRIGVVAYGPHLTVSRASPLVEQLLGAGVRPGEPIERLYELLAARHARGAALSGDWGLVATALRTGRPQYAELRLDDGSSGPRLALRVSLLPGPLPSGAVEEGGLALVVQDVSDLWRAELHHSRLAQLAQRALQGGELVPLLEEVVVVVTETLDASRGEVLELVDEGESLLARAATGWPGGAAAVGELPVGPPGSLLARTLAQDAPIVEDLRGDPRRAPVPWGAAHGLSASVTALIGVEGTVFGLLGVHAETPRRFAPDEVEFVRSVATVLAMAVERSRAEQRMIHQALHDPLTGLANRTLLLDRLETALSTARRFGRRVGLLLMDLDRFKEINDTLGHDVGDEVLRIVGGRLAGALRGTDTVARLGGDEFAVVLPELADAGDGLRVAEKLREECQRTIEHDGVPLHVEGSVGLAICPEHGMDAITLLKRADVAMYRAKRLTSGVATYCAANDRLRPERLAYAGALHEAMDTDQLVLHYQPRVDLASGRVTAVEALLRWQHPQQGLLGPMAFVPLAEQTGLIERLTHRVLALAMRQARAWHTTGRDVTVAVNVSARVLHDTDLVGMVTQELGLAGVPPSALELELTESAIMSSPSNALVVTEQLRGAGVRLSIDDFGTGYSSLAWLQNLPVHQLKIDKSFVRDAGGNAKDALIVRSVIDLGHNLGLRVVGEGIETAETCALLRDLGCDEGQGFYLGRPAPASAATLARA